MNNKVNIEVAFSLQSPTEIQIRVNGRIVIESIRTMFIARQFVWAIRESLDVVGIEVEVKGLQ